jgi:four helix bundle protein
MSQLQHARSFRDLIVHQKARAVAKRVFEVTKSFPREEMYSLTDQIRRSSRSVGAQIAEAWAKRRYEKHFVSKLTDADGEQQETQHWIETAAECGYLKEEEVRSLNSELTEIGRMLNSMIEKVASFCGEPPFTLRESAVDYFTTTDD